jgi:methyl-accepting chemotaxis protein
LNQAVGEIDKVVQQNAAGAEQSSAASEHLKTQADQLKSLAGGLACVVNGARKEKPFRDPAALAWSAARQQKVEQSPG